MSAFPPEREPVAAICRNRNCGRGFYTLYLEQRYCSVHCKDAAAKARRRERDRAGEMARPHPLEHSSTSEQVKDTIAEIMGDRMRAVAAAQDKALAEGKSKEEAVRIGQDVLTTFKPQMSEMERVLKDIFHPETGVDPKLKE